MYDLIIWISSTRFVPSPLAQVKPRLQKVESDSWQKWGGNLSESIFTEESRQSFRSRWPDIEPSYSQTSPLTDDDKCISQILKDVPFCWIMDKEIDRMKCFFLLRPYIGRLCKQFWGICLIYMYLTRKSLLSCSSMTQQRWFSSSPWFGCSSLQNSPPWWKFEEHVWNPPPLLQPRCSDHRSPWLRYPGPPPWSGPIGGL